MLRPKRVLAIMLAALFFLMFMHVLLLIIRPALGYGYHQVWGLVVAFDIGSEANVPTYWSVVVMVAAGLLPFWIAAEARRKGLPFVWQWRVLGTLLLLMSLDEAAQLHDGVLGRIWNQTVGRGEGIAYYGWYLPLIPVVILIGLAYLPFLRHLPRRYTWFFVASAAVYFLGAIGAEMVESVLAFRGFIGPNAESQIIEDTSQLVEESLEIAGMTLFVYALLDYLVRDRSTLIVKVDQP